MNSLPHVILKSIVVAWISFWTIYLIDLGEFNPLFIIGSILPVSIICSLVILITVFPFTTMESKAFTKLDIFKTYFPLYALLSFSIGLLIIILSNFNGFACAFSASSYLTLMITWVWLFKPTTS